MKRTIKGALAALAIFGLGAVASADSIIPGVVTDVTPMTGTNGVTSFVASVTSTFYLPGTAPAAYLAALGPGAAVDFVYGYQASNLGHLPGTTQDSVDLLSVAAGAPVDATAEVTGAALPTNTATGANLWSGGSAKFFFGPVTPPPTTVSPILLFASPNGPSFQTAFVGDSGVDSTGIDFVISEGPTPPGLPLPAPAAAWGGLGLLGLLAFGKARQKIRA